MRFGTAARRLAAGLVVLGLAFSAPAMAQVSVERIKVHSRSVAGNLEGNSADREVIVVLPPSYGKAKKRRYPVVYFLHGFTATAEKYDDFIKFSDAMNAEAAKGHQMILVVPDSYTKHGGAMYSSSVTTGNFEGFIAHDLVAYVDEHYRTLAKRASRGLAGHSMGGYGTFKIGMKYPEVFSSLYAMSSCCLPARTITPERGKQLEAMTMDEALKGDFGVRGNFATASAWSPAPDKPPFFLEIGTKDGVVQPDVIAQWAANAPLAMAPQYISALRSFTAIAMDVGDKDSLIDGNKAMTDLLTRFGVAHSYTVYDGNHVDHVKDRFKNHVLPFFAEQLAKK